MVGADLDGVTSPAWGDLPGAHGAVPWRDAVAAGSVRLMFVTLPDAAYGTAAPMSVPVTQTESRTAPPLW